MKTKKRVYSRIRLLIMLFVVVAGLSMTVCVHAATVAKIGSSSYSSIAKALYAAKNGQTVKLVKNATYSPGIIEEASLYNKKVTINLNKKKLTIKKPLYIGNKSNVTIKNGKIGFKNNAHIWVLGKSTVKIQGCAFTMKLNNNLVAREKSNLTLKNCNISGSDVTIGSEDKSKITIDGGKYVFKGYSTLAATGGYFTIKKGSFTNKQKRALFAINPLVGMYTGNINSTLTIEGGSFTGPGAVIYLGKSQKCTITGGNLSSSQDTAIEAYGILNVKGGTISGGHPSDNTWSAHGILCFETAKVKLYKGATVKGGNNTAIGYSYNKGAVVKNYGAVLVDAK